MKANPEKFQFIILCKKSSQPQKLSVKTFQLINLMKWNYQD